jgi:hypothetical protein
LHPRNSARVVRTPAPGVPESFGAFSDIFGLTYADTPTGPPSIAQALAVVRAWLKMASECPSRRFDAFVRFHRQKRGYPDVNVLIRARGGLTADERQRFVDLWDLGRVWSQPVRPPTESDINPSLRYQRYLVRPKRRADGTVIDGTRRWMTASTGNNRRCRHRCRWAADIHVRVLRGRIHAIIERTYPPAPRLVPATHVPPALAGHARSPPKTALRRRGC